MNIDWDRAGEILAETIKQITEDPKALAGFEAGHLVITLSTFGIGVWDRGRLAAALIEMIHADGGTFEMVPDEDIADHLGAEAEKFLEDEDGLS